MKNKFFIVIKILLLKNIICKFFNFIKDFIFFIFKSLRIFWIHLVFRHHTILLNKGKIVVKGKLAYILYLLRSFSIFIKFIFKFLRILLYVIYRPFAPDFNLDELYWKEIKIFDSKILSKKEAIVEIFIRVGLDFIIDYFPDKYPINFKDFLNYYRQPYNKLMFINYVIYKQKQQDPDYFSNNFRLFLEKAVLNDPQCDRIYVFTLEYFNKVSYRLFENCGKLKNVKRFVFVSEKSKSMTVAFIQDDFIYIFSSDVQEIIIKEYLFYIEETKKLGVIAFIKSLFK